MAKRSWWRGLLLLAVCQAQETEEAQCLQDGKKLDPEALSSFTWHGLATNESAAFYRCLHDVTSLQTMFSALYFSIADAPESVSVKEAPGLGTIWLNPAVQTHHLWYAHGPEQHQQHHVLVQGSSLTVDLFPNAESCGSSTDAVCSVLEVAEKDVACIASKDEACKVQVVERMLRLKADQWFDLKGKDQEAAYCTMAVLAATTEDARSAMTWLSGYPAAQCLLTKCDGGDDTLIDYEALYSCKLNGNAPFMTFVCLLLLFYYFILMGVVADGYLVPVLIQIGRTLKMSDALLGATLLALGGSANDFMTGFVSALAHTEGGSDGSSDNDVRLWLGGVFGTGVFINTFVASLVLLFAGPEGIQVDSSVLSRDISFRFLAVGLMILFGWFGFVSTYMALFMNLLYIFYVYLSLRESQKQQREPVIDAPSSVVAGPRSRNSSFTAAETGSAPASFVGRGSRVAASFQALAGQHVVERASFTGDSWKDRMKRHAGWDEEGGFVEKLSFFLAIPLRPFLVLTMATTTWDSLVNVLLPLGMCIFVPFGNPFGNVYTSAFQDAAESKSAWPSRITLVAFWLAGLALSLATWSTSRNLPPRQYVAQTCFSWATFLTSLLWVGLFANEVVGAMQLLGIIMGLKPMAEGITLLAWGNCVDNVFGLLGLAKAGEYRVAITGIYAGPMFNVLFGTPGGSTLTEQPWIV